ncbi:MAG: TRAP transporter large permease [Albidovulum sp.]|nr:TRAP transporter large permease [Albidovulum sp.]
MSLGLMFVILAVLLVLEVPVAFALIFSSMSFLLLDGTFPLNIVVQRMAPGLDSFPLLAIPLFVFAGNLFNKAGIAARIFDFALALVGHIRGSLAHVNVVASIIFAGMSGVAQADAAGLGVVEIRAMKKAGFDGAFSAAVTAASSIIGPIIPPSVILLIYAVTAQTSVSAIFLAGVLPGLMIGGLLMVLIYFMALSGMITAPVREVSKRSDVLRTFWRAIPAILAPVVLVFGLIFGIATPTELGAVTVIYAIAFGFISGNLTVKSLMRAAFASSLTTGILVFIISAAIPFGWVISVNALPQALTEFILSISTNKYVVLLLINLLLLVIGCIMETTAILLIAIPTLLPLLNALEIDLVHFGVIMVFNLLIGAATPPFGVLLFIMVDIAEEPFGKIVKAIIPFYIPLILALLLITFVPALTLWLPGALGE